MKNSKFLKNIFNEFRKVWLHYLVFLLLFIIMGVVFFLFNYYQPVDKEIFEFNNGSSYLETKPLISGYNWENWGVCGTLGLGLMSLMFIMMIYRLYAVEKKDKQISYVITMPLSRNEIMISKILVIFLSSTSILIITALLESIALSTYTFAGDHSGGYYFASLILNYFNFIILMFLTLSVYFIIYLFIDSVKIATWVVIAIYCFSLITSVSGYLLTTADVGSVYYSLFNIIHYFWISAFANNNLIFHDLNPVPTVDGTYYQVYEVTDNNLIANIWKIPLMLISIAAINVPTIYWFNKIDFNL